MAHDAFLNRLLLLVFLFTYSASAAVAKDLRDAEGRLIGRITAENGRIVARDAGGRYLGYATKDPTKTFDANGRLIGNADLLAVIIIEEDRVRRVAAGQTYPNDALLTKQDAAFARTARDRLLEETGGDPGEITWMNPITGNYGVWRVDTGFWEAWQKQLTCRKLTMTVTTPGNHMTDEQEQIYCLDRAKSGQGWTLYRARTLAPYQPR